MVTGDSEEIFLKLMPFWSAWLFYSEQISFEKLTTDLHESVHDENAEGVDDPDAKEESCRPVQLAPQLTPQPTKQNLYQHKIHLLVL